jgi:hypothetical protein
MDFEKEIIKLKERNSKVDKDKARETSITRKILIAGLTYVFIVLFFYIIDVSKPLINALVPTL